MIGSKAQRVRPYAAATATVRRCRIGAARSRADRAGVDLYAKAKPVAIKPMHVTSGSAQHRGRGIPKPTRLRGSPRLNPSTWSDCGRAAGHAEGESRAQRRDAPEADGHEEDAQALRRSGLDTPAPEQQTQDALAAFQKMESRKVRWHNQGRNTKSVEIGGGGGVELKRTL